MSADRESPIIITPSRSSARRGSSTDDEKPKQAADVNGFTRSYLRLCRGQARQLCSRLEPRPGDWILSPDEQLSLCPDPARALETGEVVVPRLDRVVELLRSEVHAFVIDCYPEDYACAAFDEASRSLANVVSKSPEEAGMRALLFVISEKVANAIS